jgi:primosomal protein N''
MEFGVIVFLLIVIGLVTTKAIAQQDKIDKQDIDLSVARFESALYKTLSHALATDLDKAREALEKNKQVVSSVSDFNQFLANKKLT